MPDISASVYMLPGMWQYEKMSLHQLVYQNQNFYFFMGIDLNSSIGGAVVFVLVGVDDFCRTGL